MLPVCLLLVLVVVPASAQDSAVQEAKRILVLFENESTLFAAMEAARGLRDELYDRPRTRIELYSEYLDILRFPQQKHAERMHRSLAAKYEGLQFDLVVALGSHALRFLLTHRDELAPGAPLVFGGVNERLLSDIPIDGSTWGLFSHFDLVRTLELATAIHPRARRVVVLTGSSPFDELWRNRTNEDLGLLHRGLEVSHLTGHTLDEFKDAASKLTPDTILLVLTVFEDADHRSYIPAEVAEEIAAVSGAPAYGVYDTFLGSGVVGGFVDTFHGMGKQVGVLAHDVLAGTPPAEHVSFTTGNFAVDWRQLKRWGVDMKNIPHGTRVEFYDPTVWEEYRLQILIAGAVILFQTATILGLIITDRRRRQIAAELNLQRLELAHLSRAAQLGELSGAFAHELNQPLTAILANAEAGVGLLSTEPVDLEEVREILSDIVADDKRAADYITQIRKLMRKEEGNLERMDLNQAVRGTVDLIRSELLARNTYVQLQMEPGALMVRGNAAQLQQIIINLVVNAVEAVRGLPPDQRVIELTTRGPVNGSVQVSVSDKGPGVDEQFRGRLFKPFVTSKDDGLGLGLAICRTIAMAHDGTLVLDETDSPGARFVLTLPAA